MSRFLLYRRISVLQINSPPEMKTYYHVLLVLLALVYIVSINVYEISAFSQEAPVPGKLS